MAGATKFAYKVRDRSGKILEGSLEAKNAELVGQKLREMGYTPMRIEKKADSSLKKDIKIPGLSDRVKLKDVSIFSRQFATMINSGLSLMRALHILADQTENTKLKGIVREVASDVEKGQSLSQALAKHPKVFNRLYIAMVRAGETGGVLDSVLMQLAHTIEKQVELKRKISSALTYPVAVLALVLMILTAMLLFVVPMFEDLYSDLGGTLPVPTQILLAVSRIVTKWAPVIFVAEIIGVILFKRWIGTDKGRAVWNTIKLKIPVFGSLIHKTSLARFSRTLESLMRAGVPILEALEITAETVGNHVMEMAVLDVQASVKAGESIAGPMASHDIFPPMVTQMMAVGEETGALDEMLGKIGEFYEAEVEATVEALTSLLEPLLIVVLGGTVGGMVIALYMPMFNIINLIE